MKQIINLGQINSEEVLYLDHQFLLQANANVSFRFKCEKVQGISANICDSQGQVRLQIIDGNQSMRYTVAREVSQTSANGIFGELPSGEWLIEGVIFGHPGQTCELEIFVDEEDLPVHSYTSILNEQRIFDYSRLDGNDLSIPCWVKCDLHTHTTLSDGAMTIEENQVQAGEMNLDFYVATDHNICPSMWYLAENQPLVFPGVEVTSPLGHFNLLFAKDFIFNYHTLQELGNSEDLLAIIRTIKEKKMGLVSVNHPFLTIWKWLVHDLPLSLIDTIEIINDPTYKDNQAANLQTLQFWDALLNDGYFIPVVGGSDSHLKPDNSYEDSYYPSVIGDPGTYLYVDELKAEKLEQAIVLGHVVVTRFGFLNVTFNDWIPGDRIYPQDLPDVLSIHFDYQQEEAMKVRIELVRDGKVLKTSTDLVGEWHLTKAELEGSYHWLRVQIINELEGDLLGVSNPLIIGSKESQFKTWADVLEVAPDTTPDQ